MAETYRALAEKEKGTWRVYLFEKDLHEEKYGRPDSWSVLDIAEHKFLEEIVRHLDEKHDFQTNTVLVREASGEWTPPDCLSLAEALECSFEGAVS